jgi:hypothetical protein
LVLGNNKSDKPLAKLSKIKKEKIRIDKIKDKECNVATDPTEIKRIIKEAFENLYYN